MKRTFYNKKKKSCKKFGAAEAHSRQTRNATFRSLRPHGWVHSAVVQNNKHCFRQTSRWHCVHAGSGEFCILRGRESWKHSSPTTSAQGAKQKAAARHAHCTKPQSFRPNKSIPFWFSQLRGRGMRCPCILRGPPTGFQFFYTTLSCYKHAICL